jgi:hypothetical protein
MDEYSRIGRYGHVPKLRNVTKKDINMKPQDIYVIGGKVKVKVKFTLEQATEAQGGCRCIAIHFL